MQNFRDFAEWIRDAYRTPDDIAGEFYIATEDTALFVTVSAPVILAGSDEGGGWVRFAHFAASGFYGLIEDRFQCDPGLTCQHVPEAVCQQPPALHDLVFF